MKLKQLVRRITCADRRLQYISSLQGTHTPSAWKCSLHW